MPIANDIIRKQGDTYPIEVSVLRENGAPLDLSGADSFKLGVAETEILTPPDLPSMLLTGSVSDGLSGKVEFGLTATDADGLVPGSYFAEIQFEQSGYVITTETFNYHVKGQIVI